MMRTNSTRERVRKLEKFFVYQRRTESPRHISKKAWLESVRVLFPKQFSSLENSIVSKLQICVSSMCLGSGRPRGNDTLRCYGVK